MQPGPSPRNYRTPHSGVSQPGIGHILMNKAWAPKGRLQARAHYRPTIFHPTFPPAQHPAVDSEGPRL